MGGARDGLGREEGLGSRQHQHLQGSRRRRLQRQLVVPPSEAGAPISFSELLGSENPNFLLFPPLQLLLSYCSFVSSLSPYPLSEFKHRLMSPLLKSRFYSPDWPWPHGPLSHSA